MARRRFSQKTDEFDLFAVKSKKADRTNSSVLFLEMSADLKLLSRLTDLYVLMISFLTDA